MDKIQIIEKLFSYLLFYSYLLLPLFFIFSKSKRNSLVICLAVYGIVFFFFLNFFYDIPRSFRKFQQFLYTVLEYSLFAYVFFINLKSKKLRYLIISLSLLFFAFLTVYFFTSHLGKVDSVPVGVETIFVFIFAFVYFQQYFKHNQSYIYGNPNFWIVVGILLYLGSTFFFNILINHINQQQADQYWHLTYIPEIIKNILFSMAILFYSSYHKENQDTKKTIPYLDLDIN